MPRSTTNEPLFAFGRGLSPQISHVLGEVERGTRHVGDAEGGALALYQTGLPRVTGWFRRDISPGFSATFPHIIHDALLGPADRSATPENGPPPAATPSRTWSRLRVEGEAEPVADLWLYRGQSAEPARVKTTGSPGSSRDLTGTLAHLARWGQVLTNDDTLGLLHDFARTLNGVATSTDLFQLVADRFAAVFHAAVAAVHLFSEDQLLVTAGKSGFIPMLDGNYDPQHVTSVATATDWFFDVFALVSRDGQPIGVVTCFWHTEDDRPGASLSLARLMAEQAAASIERCRVVDRSESMLRSAATAIADAVDARDSFTRQHARRVARYSREIAEQVGLSGHEVDSVEIAGLLHDMGKIGVPDRVLQTPGSLASDDWDLIRRHPEIGAAIAGTFPSLAEVAPLIRYHHERFDGSGYPTGLRAGEIPLGARIISVAEAFDTLVTGRPYQAPWTVERTLTTLEGLSGVQFDPNVVQRLALAVRDGAIRVDIVPPVQTGELNLHRWIGAEARAFGLLKRLGNEVGELVDLGSFLRRLKEIIEAEFPTSLVDVFIRHREHNRYITMVNAHSGKDRGGVYVMRTDQGVIGWVATHGETENIPDVRLDPRYMSDDGREVLSELAVPMLLDDGCIGILNIESPRLAAFSRTDQNVLEIIAAYVAQAVQVAELHGQVKRQSELDSMTGLLNHRAFYRTLDIEVDRAARMDDCVSVAIIDVDGFKSINDSLGHLGGDAVIQRLAQLLVESVQTGDAVARYGGDEFSIIRPGVTRDAMICSMHQIDALLRTASDGSPLLRISWGVASFPEDGTQPTELVAQADAAMYASRQRAASHRSPS